MLTVISPAKTLDFDTPATTADYTQPQFLRQSEALIKQLRPLAPQDIAGLMKLSDKLASLNAARYEQWQPPFSPDNAKQAVLAFKGDVYTGLDAETLDTSALAFAQENLRILSGLYGVLRPLDLIQPYRLEMGTRLVNEQGKDLYAFWGDQLSQHINHELTTHAQPVLINLASNEYFKALGKKAIRARVITPVFKDRKGSDYKIISFYAKKARGLMSRYILEQQIQDPELLKLFTTEGYVFNATASDGDTWVFTRDHNNT